MPPMTAKTLSWATFGLLLTGSIPFVSNPEVAAAAQPDVLPLVTTLPPTLPACGACYLKPTQEFQKAYAIDRNALCASDVPYRVTVRLASKIICLNGSYWVCEDTSSMTCSAYIERPECPQDSCQR
jgi:hypothetical protein